jgi:hypothetical protein
MSGAYGPQRSSVLVRIAGLVLVCRTTLAIQRDRGQAGLTGHAL